MLLKIDYFCTFRLCSSYTIEKQKIHFILYVVRLKRNLGKEKKVESDSDDELEDDEKPAVIPPEDFDPSKALDFETEPPDYLFGEEHIDSYNAEKEAAAKAARDERDPEPYVNVKAAICQAKCQ